MGSTHPLHAWQAMVDALWSRFVETGRGCDGVVALTELTVVQALLLRIVPEFANSGTILSSKA